MDTKKLRQKILDLAIHGKLVPQDPNDEPASVLLERIRSEKERLIKEGKIKRSRKTTKTTGAACDKQEVPFEVPSGWVWTTLDDLAFYKKGPFGSCLTKSMFVPKSDNTYKVYEQKNAIQKNEFLGSYYISKEKYNELNGFAVQPFDIIVSCAGTIGETYVLSETPEQGIINQALMLIRLHSRCVEDFYLIYFDYILKEEAYKESKGTAIKNIPPFDVLKNFFIPLPPLSEQQRIVEEIERWFKLIEIIEQGKADLQTTIKQAKNKILELAIHGKLVPQDPNDEPASELLKRVNPKAEITCDNGHYPKLPKGWAICRLEDIIEYEQPTAYIVKSTAYSDDYSTPVLTAGKSFIIGHTDETEGIYNKLPCIIFDDFTKDSRLVDFPFKVKSSAMKILQVNKGIDIEYVSQFMSITRLVGDTHKRYWISEYSKLEIPIPPQKEQKRIIRMIHQLFKNLETIEENL
ncbi:restriction endonuclease subunit S [Prevotella melaninogenica]|uniref:Restriction endonuclease subunit S n=3 Tax=Prevotella melaninogenica TaxID=28132 RepID=A0A7D4JNQ1_9BACT|nr:restriction endonuclease subunit S [Prevotella melaninogenica]QKH88059.1 restriction endonuclease subunit S [Prevotella melaninogenica]